MNFNEEVLDLSEEIPVLVDFWAEWCGPCRVLGPIIEGLAEEAGNWKLVKVNVDQHPDLSQQFQIRGIPAVKMFHRKKVIAEFTGVLSKPQIQQWLDTHLPDERKVRLAELIDELRAGKPVLDQLETFHLEHPGLTEARVALAQQKVFSHPDQAIDLLSSIRMGNSFWDQAEKIRALAQLADYSCENEPLHPAEKSLSSASEALLSKRFEQVFEHLIQSLMYDKHLYDGLARRAGIALFAYLGEHSELAKTYRRRFDMALF